MPLDDEQKEKFGAWLHAKNCDPSCPSCGHNEWSFGDITEAAPANDPTGDATPLAMLICKHCAFVRFHAARPIGLVED